MEGVSESAERILFVEAAELLQNLTIEPPQKPADVREEENQPVAVQDTAGDQSDGTPDATSPVPSIDGTGNPGVYDFAVDSSMFYPPSGYPQQTYYYGCYDGPIGEWDEYARYVNVDGTEVTSPGIYGDNGPVLYHPGYAYNPQMPYGSYSPAGAPIPSVRADGPLYGPPQYQYQATYYQQPVHPNSQYISSPPTLTPGDASVSGVVDQRSSVVDIPNGNSVNGNFSRQLAMMPSQSAYGRGILPVTIPGPCYPDGRAGYDGMRLGAPWTDSPNVPESHQRPLTSVLETTGSQSPAMAPPSVAAPETLGQNVQPVPQPIVQTAPQQWSSSGSGYGVGMVNRIYPSNRVYPSINNSGRVSPGFGSRGFDMRPFGRNWIAIDKSRSRGRGFGVMFNGNVNGSLDISSEQNRGPRTSRNRMVSGVAQLGKGSLGKGSTSNGSSEENCVIPSREKYNLPDFVTNYSDAKFFIIKSYSEDDIHKSIKYSVWASTPNGNKKLDAAYKEAREKAGGCPVFLFFSVNASGQFCGVAEMVGPVDFMRNVDYWQQDKWSGRLPVNWVIIKDIPNAQFRHITLENNDNKPVTNSRDTQEVKLNEGLEMLNIFKIYDCKTSILDDFLYYEAREKAMQERKAKQAQQQQASDSRHFFEGVHVELIVNASLISLLLPVNQVACQSATVILNLPSNDAALKEQESGADNDAVQGGHGNSDQKSSLEERAEFPSQSRNADGAEQNLFPDA